MVNSSQTLKWNNYLSFLGVLGLLGFINPYFSSLGALVVFNYWGNEDPDKRKAAYFGFMAFIGPIVLLLSLLMK